MIHFQQETPQNISIFPQTVFLYKFLCWPARGTGYYLAVFGDWNLSLDIDETDFTENQVNEYKGKFAKVVLLSIDSKLNFKQILLEWGSIHVL